MGAAPPSLISGCTGVGFEPGEGRQHRAGSRGRETAVAAWPTAVLPETGGSLCRVGEREVAGGWDSAAESLNSQPWRPTTAVLGAERE